MDKSVAAPTPFGIPLYMKFSTIAVSVVAAKDLIAADTATGAIAGGGSRRARRRTLAADDLKDVFGVELEEAPAQKPKPKPRRGKSGKTSAEQRPATPTRPRKRGTPNPRKKTSAGKPAQRKARKPASFKPTGGAVARLRKRHGMSKAGFAKEVGVSAATVANWERTAGAIAPQAKGLAGLTRLHRRKP